MAQAGGAPDRSDQADLPPSMKHLRACLSCKLIKTYDQFRDDQCENCENFSTVSNFTTPTFYGMMAMMKPDASWTARWQRQTRFVAGLYALKVVGEVRSEMDQLDDFDDDLAE
jgi:transcription elongation factor SPT4